MTEIFVFFSFLEDKMVPDVVCTCVEPERDDVEDEARKDVVSWLVRGIMTAVLEESAL